MRTSGYFVDLFAGCGGFSLGLEQAGLMPVFVCELNDDALKTYLNNRRAINTKLDSYRISDINEMVANTRYISQLMARLDKDFPKMHGTVDLVIGGPPCQGFSGIGHRRSYSVERRHVPSNQLYKQMATVIKRVRPKAFIFENVRGLMSARWTNRGSEGEVFEDVLDTFDALPGYRIASSLVYARHYGVPQNRPRVLIVGIHDDIAVPGEDFSKKDAVQRGFLPPPIESSAPHPEEVIGDLIDPNYRNGVKSTDHYPVDPMNDLQRRFRTDRRGVVFPIGHPVQDHQYSRHREHVIQKFEAIRSDRRHLPAELRTKKFSQRLIPRRWGEQGPTITATSLPDDYVHFAQPRTLTVREWARLQTFPDWYQFAGKRTTGGLRRAGNPRAGLFEREVPKYTQIGNAVPVELARRIGDYLAPILR